jgi:[NiFe] hydrogenase diaphorase moiety large subunit
MSGIGLRSGGSFMVFNKDRDVLSILQNITDFFIAESCGICVPCRTGNFLLSKKIIKLKAGNGIKKDLEDTKDWAKIIKQSSRCGLGKTSTNCLLTAMLKFPEVFDNQLQEESDFSHAFEMETATKDFDTFVKEIQSSYE